MFLVGAPAARTRFAGGFRSTRSAGCLGLAGREIEAPPRPEPVQPKTRERRRRILSRGADELRIYRGTVADALGAKLAPDAIVAARDSLGGALTAAGALPEPLGAALVNASRGAFVDAFQTTALASAMITLLASVAAAGRGSGEGVRRWDHA